MLTKKLQSQRDTICRLGIIGLSTKKKGQDSYINWRPSTQELVI